MKELQIFSNEEFGEIRTITKDNEPWFVASDIAKALGYRMASDMTRRIDEEDKGYTKVRTQAVNKKCLSSMRVDYMQECFVVALILQNHLSIG